MYIIIKYIYMYYRYIEYIIILMVTLINLRNWNNTIRRNDQVFTVYKSINAVNQLLHHILFLYGL